MRNVKKNKKPIPNNKKIAPFLKGSLFKKCLLVLSVIIISIILIIVVPIIINESYKMNKGYITLWDAPDVLSYYAVILSGIITIVALIVTIHHTNKDTEKQLNFYKSQVNTPFFTIEDVFQLGANRFNHGDTNVWEKQIEIYENGDISEDDKTVIEIVLINKGQGIALDPSYKIDMFSYSNMFNYIVNKDDSISITYDFNKNLNDKWIKSFFSNTLATGDCDFYTYVDVFYKNTMGIIFKQRITIKINIDFATKNLNLYILPISSQEIIEKN